MAFILSQKQSYAWPVKVKVPNNGKWDTHTFVATFARLAPLDAQERLKDLADAELPPEERYQRENEFMEEVLLGWEGIKDEDGVPIAFGAETRATVLDVPEVRRALFDAYFESAIGKRVEAKN